MRHALPVIALLVYPLATHALILGRHPLAAVAGLVAISLFALITRDAKSNRISRSWKGVSLLVVVVGMMNLFTHSVHAVYLPSILVNVALMLLVASSLRPGAVPFLERLFRLQQASDLSPVVVREAYRLTWVWAWFFGLMAVASLGLALLAPLEIWSWFANVLYFVFLVGLMLGMHVYQHFRLRRHGAPLRLAVLRTMVRLKRTDPTHPLFGYAGEARK